MLNQNASQLIIVLANHGIIVRKAPYKKKKFSKFDNTSDV